MAKQPATIGILAGMGPRSTAPFVDQIVTECQTQYGASFDEDFPPMMMYSLPTPFFVDRPIDHVRMQDVIIGGLRRLEAAGADFIVMPCNSAHRYFDALRAAVRVPLLNMVDEASVCLGDAESRMALIGTRPTVEAGMYQRAIERRGQRLIHDGSVQSRVDELILSIKSSRDMSGAQALWDQLQIDVMAKGADTFLIACTDLDAINLETAATVVNATQCLAAAAVREWMARR
ncbi:MAG: amino acid racemase [Chloroflexi bacterium]|nr:amino acid racemase [Chloroflexota bacterium]